MNRKRQLRLYGAVFVVLGICLSVGLVLYALRQNINLFYTPSQVTNGEVPSGHAFRIGGLVVNGSVKRSDIDLQVSFLLTDTQQQTKVTYLGILPDLFREGQGIVAQGKLNNQGVVVADQVLAKHDENYMPPEVKQALEQAKRRAS